MILDLLAHGTISVKGRLPRSTNAIFLVEVADTAAATLAVYKPLRGERPLWDFPPGLFKREVAAYLLSEALGWGLVPPTVRREGPLGEGSLQRLVDADADQHYFTVREQPSHRERLQRICLLDLVANNADRKSGHCLLDGEGLVWAIDNALTFHVEPKLRTVIWDFAGEPVPEPMLVDMRRLGADGLPRALTALLQTDEQAALLARVRAIVTAGRFPTDRGRYPWPPV